MQSGLVPMQSSEVEVQELLRIASEVSYCLTLG